MHVDTVVGMNWFEGGARQGPQSPPPPLLIVGVSFIIIVVGWVCLLGRRCVYDVNVNIVTVDRARVMHCRHGNAESGTAVGVGRW